jgi:hypothetical protein
MIEVEAPDGTVIEFPEGTSRETIRKVMAKNYGQPETGNPAAEATSAGARGFNKSLTDAAGLPAQVVGGMANNNPLDMLLSAVGLGDYSNKAALAAKRGDDGSIVKRTGGEAIRAGVDAGVRAVKPDFEGIGYNDISELPRDYRWAGRVGEVAGSAAPMAAGTLLAGRGIQLGSKVAPSANPLQSQILDAANNPVGYAGREAAIAGGAAQAAGALQAVNPDAGDLASAGAQMAGSVFNPLGMATKAAGGVAEGARNFVLSRTEGGRKLAAARIMQGKMLEGGELPSAAAANLDAPDVIEGGRVAERSGSRVLLGLEERAKDTRPDFKRRVEASMAAASDEVEAKVRDTLGGGDARPLREAAVARHDSMAQAVDNFVEEANARALKASDDLAVANPAARADAQMRSREILDQAYEEGRAVEKQLWESLDLGSKVKVNNSLGAWKEFQKSQSLIMRELPSSIKEEMGDLFVMSKNGRGKVTASKVQNLRSQLLEYGRTAGDDAGKFKRIVNGLADSLLDDLAPIDRIGDARAYSRLFHDKWSRTTAGRSQETTARGAQKVRPEETLDAVATGGATRANANFRELREAGEPVGASGTDRSGMMRESQEVYLRDKIAEMRPNDETPFDPRQLEKAARRGAPLYDAVDPKTGRPVFGKEPAVASLGDEMRATASTVRGVNEQVESVNRAWQTAQKQDVFKKVIGSGEAPHRAIEGILRGTTPSADYVRLSALAQRGGKEAVGGLRSATMDLVFGDAKQIARESGGFWHGVERRLFKEGATPGYDPVGKLMRDGGVLNATQTHQLKKLVERGKRIEKSQRAGSALYQDKLGPDTDDFFDYGVRILGANVGGMTFTGANSGAPLVAAQYGSRFFRKMLEDVPNQKIADIMVNALDDPALMKELLTKPVNIGARQRVAVAIAKHTDERMIAAQKAFDNAKGLAEKKTAAYALAKEKARVMSTVAGEATNSLGTGAAALGAGARAAATMNNGERDERR